MYKNRRIRFFIVCGAYFSVTFLDLWLTYLATPNLYLEGNPLVDSLGWGWTGLILINVITCIGYVFMARYAFIKYEPRQSEQTDMKRYLADINYKDPEKSVPFMYKLPKDWGPQLACMCWSVCIALPFSRLVIVFEWLLMVLRIRAPLFFSIVAIFPGGRIDFFLAVILAWALSFLWIKLDFKAHLDRLNGKN